MDISKNLKIESKDHLYKLIDTNEELSSNKIFIDFMNRMYSLYYGCDCNIEAFEENSTKAYYELLNNEEAKSKLKEFFKCDGIIFN